MLSKVINRLEPAGLKEVTIIRYEEIPTVNSVVVDDVVHNLGILKDFKKNNNLEQFIPESSKLSISWVRLDKGQVLDIHKHPIDSMIIITNGEVALCGDKEDILYTGDIVAIPKNCTHGFIGRGNNGFHGLSIQFENRGLYEDIASPLVEFIGNNREGPYEKLISDNARYVEEFDNNALFILMRSNTFNDLNLRNKFFDCFQVFSNYFQKMMMNRVCFTDNELYLPIFELHLEEEFGHNTRLKEDRNKRQQYWDPILEATSLWFASKMLSLDNLEKIVLVNLVVETSACTFYKNAKNIFALNKQNSKHFDIHMTDIDNVHANLGSDLIMACKVTDFIHLANVQKQGWEMLNTAFNRIAELIVEK